MSPNIKLPHASNTESGSEEAIKTKTQELEERIARGEKWLIFFTGVIAFSTIAYAVIAGFQLGVMTRQLAEMQSGSAETKFLAESAKKQADNTDKLATAAINQVKQLEASVKALQDNAKASTQIAGNAEKSINVAERQARISLRAWIVPARTEFTQFEVGKVVTIRVEFKNNGRTPAINASTNGQAEWFLNSNPRPPLNPFLQPEPLGKTTIRSDGSGFLPLDLYPLTEAILQEIHSGQRTIRVHGKTWYDDVFNHHHWMTFCKEYDDFAKGFVTCDVEGEQIDSDPE